MSGQALPSTTPQDQFCADVLPPYEAYMNDKGSEWLAKAAGAAVAHFAEHVWVYYDHHDRSQLYGTRTADDYVDHLANGCPELKIIWDFALANKHRFLTRRAQNRMVTTSTDAIAASDDRLWMSDSNRYYDEVLELAMDFWRGRLPVLPIYS